MGAWIAGVGYTLGCLAVGGAAVAIGTFIGDRWREPGATKWSLLVGVLIFGFVLFNARAFLEAFGLSFWLPSFWEVS